METDQIKDLTRRLRDSWNEGDLARFMDCYEKSEHVVLIANGKRIRGWGTLHQSFQEMFDHGEQKGHFACDDECIELLTQDYALLCCKWTLLDGVRSLNGICSLVLRKRDGVWRIILDHS